MPTPILTMTATPLLVFTAGGSLRRPAEGKGIVLSLASGRTAGRGKHKRLAGDGAGRSVPRDGQPAKILAHTCFIEFLQNKHDKNKQPFV